MIEVMPMKGWIGVDLSKMSCGGRWLMLILSCIGIFYYSNGSVTNHENIGTVSLSLSGLIFIYEWLLP